MKVLYIGGTGNISRASSIKAINDGIDLYVLNRATNGVKLPGATSLIGDIYNKEHVKAILKDHTWDVVVNWIAFSIKDIHRDIELFSGNTKQYIFISTASAYQKPPLHPLITESTPLFNPFWKYSQDKINCEHALMNAYKLSDFPITIVRPSHTYDTVIPVAIGGWKEYTIIDRMKKGKKIIIHGDGTSLWTVTHSEDFAKGFNGLIGNSNAIGEAFHITNDEWLTWNQIYAHVADAAGIELQAVHVTTDFINNIIPGEKDGLWGDKSHCGLFDNSKIKRFVPDYTATIPFSEGIKKTLRWFEADPKRMIVKEETNVMMDKILKAYGTI